MNVVTEILVCQHSAEVQPGDAEQDPRSSQAISSFVLKGIHSASERSVVISWVLLLQ